MTDTEATLKAKELIGKYPRYITPAIMSMEISNPEDWNKVLQKMMILTTEKTKGAICKE